MGKCASRDRIGKSLHSRVRKLPASGKQGETSGIPEEVEKQPFFVKDRETPEEISAKTLTARKEEDEDEVHKKLISSSVTTEESEDAIRTVPPNATQDDFFPEFPVLNPEETSVKQYHSKSRSSSSDAAASTLKHHEVQRSVPPPVREVISLSTAVPVQEHSQDSSILPTGDAIKKHSHQLEAQSIDDRPFTQEKESISPNTCYQVENNHPEKQENFSSSHLFTCRESTATVGEAIPVPVVTSAASHEGETEKCQHIPKMPPQSIMDSDQSNQDVAAESFERQFEVKHDPELSKSLEKSEDIQSNLPTLVEPDMDRDIQTALDEVSKVATDRVGLRSAVGELKDSSDRDINDLLEQKQNDVAVITDDTSDLVDTVAEASEIMSTLHCESGSELELTRDGDHTSPKSSPLEETALQEDFLQSSGQEQQIPKAEETLTYSTAREAVIFVDTEDNAPVYGKQTKESDTVQELAAAVEADKLLNQNEPESYNAKPEILNVDAAAEMMKLEAECKNISSDQHASTAMMAENTETNKEMEVAAKETGGQIQEASEPMVHTPFVQEEEEVSSSQGMLEFKGQVQDTDGLHSIQEDNKTILEHDSESKANINEILKGIENTSLKDNDGDDLENSSIVAAEPQETDLTKKHAITEVARQEDQEFDKPEEPNLHCKNLQESGFAESTMEEEELNKRSPNAAHITGQDSSALQEQDAIDDKGCPQTADLHQEAALELHGVKNQEFQEQEAVSQKEHETHYEVNTKVETDDGKVQVKQPTEEGKEGAEEELHSLQQIQDVSSETTMASAPRDFNVEVSQGTIATDTYETPTDNLPECSQDITPTTSEESSRLSEDTLFVEPFKSDTENLADIHSINMDTSSAPEKFEDRSQVPSVSDFETQLDSQEPATAPETCDLEKEEFTNQDINHEAAESKASENFNALNREATTEDGKMEIIQHASGLEVAEEDLQPPSQTDDAPSVMTAGDVPKDLNEELSKDVIAPEPSEAPSDNEPESSQDITSTILDKSSDLSETLQITESPKSEADIVSELHNRDLNNLSVPDEQGHSQEIDAPDVKTHLDLQESSAASNICNLEEEQEVAKRGIHTSHDGNTSFPQTDLHQDAAPGSLEVENQEATAEHEETEKQNELNREATTTDGKTEIPENTSALEDAKEELQPPPQIQDLPSEMTVGDTPRELNDELSQDAIFPEVLEAPGGKAPASSQGTPSAILEESFGSSETLAVVEPLMLVADKVPDLSISDLDNLSVTADEHQESSQVLDAPDVKTHLDLQESSTAADICNLTDEEQVKRQGIHINEGNTGFPQTDLHQDTALESLGMEIQELKEQGAVKHEESQKKDALNIGATTADGKMEIPENAPALQGAEKQLQPPPQTQDLLPEMTAGDAPRELKDEVCQDAIVPEVLEAPGDNVPESSQHMTSTILEESSGSFETLAVVEPTKSHADMVPDLPSSDLENLSVPVDELQESSQGLDAPDIKTHLDLEQSSPASDSCNLEEKQEVGRPCVQVSDEGNTGLPQTELHQDAVPESHGAENQELKEQGDAAHGGSEMPEISNRDTATADGKMEVPEITSGLEGAEEELLPPPGTQDLTFEMTTRELNDELSQDAIVPEVCEAPGYNVPESSQDRTSSTLQESSGSFEALAVVEPAKLDAGMVPDPSSSDLDSLSVPEELQESSQVDAAPDIKPGIDSLESATPSIPEEEEAAGQNVQSSTEGNTGYLQTYSNKDVDSGLHAEEFNKNDTSQDGGSENHNELTREAVTANVEMEIHEETAGLQGAKEELHPPPQSQDIPSEMTQGDASRERNDELSQDAIAPEICETSSDNVPETSFNITSTISEESSALYEEIAVVEPPKLDAEMVPELHRSDLENVTVPDEVKESDQVLAAPDLEMHVESEGPESKNCNLEQEREVEILDIHKGNEGSTGFPKTDFNKDEFSETHGAEHKKPGTVNHEESENCDEPIMEVIGQTAGPKGAEKELQPPPPIQDPIQDAPSEMNASDAPISRVLDAPDVQTHCDLQATATPTNSCDLAEEPEVDRQDIYKSDNVDAGFPHNQEAPSESHRVEKQEFSKQGTNEHTKSENSNDVNQKEAMGDGKMGIDEQTASLERAEEDLQPPPQIQDLPAELTAVDAPRDVDAQLSQAAIAPEIFDAPRDKVPEYSDNIASTISEESSGLSETLTGAEPSKPKAEIVPDIQSSELDNLSVPGEVEEISQVLPASEETQLDTEECATASDLCDLEKEQDVATQNININDKGNTACLQTDLNHEATSELDGVEAVALKEQKAVEHEEIESPDKKNSEAVIADSTAQRTHQTTAGKEGDKEFQPLSQIQDITSEMASGDTPKDLDVDLPQHVTAPEICEAHPGSSLEDGSSSPEDALPMALHKDDTRNDLPIAPEGFEAGCLQSLINQEMIGNHVKSTKQADMIYNAEDSVVAGKVTQSGQKDLHGSIRDFEVGNATDNSNADADQVETVTKLWLGDHPGHVTVVVPCAVPEEFPSIASTLEPSTLPVDKFGDEDDLPALHSESPCISHEEEQYPLEKPHEFNDVTVDYVDQNGREAEKEQEQTQRDIELSTPSQDLFQSKAEIMACEKPQPDTPIATEERVHQDD